MSERLAACRALAAMIRQHGEPNEEEVKFIGMAALHLGLTAEEDQQVLQTLREGGDYEDLLKRVESRSMRAFFVRRALAAVLLDEQINEQEQAVLDHVARAFGISQQTLAELVAWMKVSIDAETHLTGLLGQI